MGPDHADAWFHLGSLRFDEGKLNEALNYCKRGQATAEARVIGDPARYTRPLWPLLRSRCVLHETNERILQNASDSLFVTIFYGELDPQSGELICANACHNPPWVFQACELNLARLRNTGMALGVIETVTWQQASLILGPGRKSFLYTDAGN